MNRPTEQQVEMLFNESINAIEQTKALSAIIVTAAILQAEALQTGGKILICGNGGSAADSLHYSSELLNKFVRVRRPLAAISLTADCSTITSIGNDESFDHIFSKQIEALGRPEDILVAITSSGNSPSILRAVEAAHEAGMRVVTLNGRDGGELSKLLENDDIDIIVPHKMTAQIQEVHGIIIHLFCHFIDQQLFGTS